MAASEPILALNIPLAILKNENTRLKNLDGKLDVGLAFGEHLQRIEILATSFGQVYIGLLTRTDAAVEFLDFAVLDQFVENY